MGRAGRVRLQPRWGSRGRLEGCAPHAPTTSWVSSATTASLRTARSRPALGRQFERPRQSPCNQRRPDAAASATRRTGCADRRATMRPATSLGATAISTTPPLQRSDSSTPVRRASRSSTSTITTATARRPSFADRSDVLFISIHADPAYEFPWFTGHASEIGQGEGEYWNLNLPLPAGTTMQGWMAALDTALTRIADADVDALVVSLGVDTYEHDPLGTFVIIGTADFTWRSGAAINAAGLPTVVLQEGGYAVERHRRQRRSVPPTLQLTGPHLSCGESSVVSDRRASAHQATAVFVPAGTSVKPPSWICTGASTTSFAHSASCRMDDGDRPSRRFPCLAQSPDLTASTPIARRARTALPACPTTSRRTE